MTKPRGRATTKGVGDLYSPDAEIARNPLNDRESVLEKLEESWADFMHGTRARIRIVRSPTRRGVRGYTLAAVHRLLDDNRQQVKEGNRAAIFYALVRCANENVPMPYWLADEIIKIDAEASRQLRPGERPSNLHDLFGLADTLPADGKKGATARRDRQLRGKLWDKVHELIADHARELKQADPTLDWKQAIEQARDLGYDRFIKDARERLAFPYQQSKARIMFNEQERIQSRSRNALKARAVTRTHRISK